MKVWRILLIAVIVAPGPTFAAAPPKAEKAKLSKKAKDMANAEGDTGAASPLSPNATPVSLPSYTGPSSSTAPSGPGLACTPTEQKELEKITSLNMIEQQKAAQKLWPMNVEREETSVRYNALFEKQKLELSPLEFELKRLQLETNISEEKFKKDMAALREERERLHLANDVARERLAADQTKAEADKVKFEIAMRELELKSRKVRADAEAEDAKTAAIKADLELRSKKEAWKSEANRDPDYAVEPFHDGVLTISDRRISLNGPIFYGVADDVTERIHYFNNKDEKLPIFIVIDNSPGGSVREGYRIVKAIQASKAPVHVVVKSYAASMAAVIATLAPHSYTYPNAVVLHHQIRSFMGGNLTQQKEQLENLQQWYKRLADPVAKKVGYDLDSWTKQMYKHNSDGDWEEFGDVAVRLKWIDHIVHEIRETGFTKDPSENKNSDRWKSTIALAEVRDAQGHAFMQLPRLQPFDAYWIYNPDQYYR